MPDQMMMGVENCVAERPDIFAGRRFGLLLNRASVDRHLRLSCDFLAEAFPGQLKALFTPQHGLWGDVQANMIETDHGWHGGLRLPIFSLYSETRTPTPEMLEGLDALVIDLQDVGTRVYTFIWTLQQCLHACAELDLPVIVLDRPNPLGGTVVEGPFLEPSFRSFVGGESIPMRHALTIGEMARLLRARQTIPATLHVIELSGWSAGDAFLRWQRTWIPPSPNLPTRSSTYVYPGQVLLEGTNLSEGRGTTTPFEVVGAPYVDAEQLCESMRAEELEGFKFLPIQFRPTFDKWAGRVCGGVSVHITDRERCRPYAMTVRLLATVQSLYPDDFRWLEPPYEYEMIRPPIDIISGSDRLRTELGRDTADQLCQVDIEAWQQATRPALLYPRPVTNSGGTFVG